MSLRGFGNVILYFRGEVGSARYCAEYKLNLSTNHDGTQVILSSASCQ